ncbi:hypothetical protein [Hydrogenophaga sp. 2FB]|uniref:hypothetical protein n=1 Tax=Hydrogenophaga sp. 2FB TaxID=2502187 RepID=UPI001BB17CD4|nr:hypothetical protein [Hydrogenophaga sp. 2FB]
MLFDLMPMQPEVLGFSNRWYPYAVQTATAVGMAAAPAHLRHAVAMAFTRLLAHQDFANVLPGLIAEPKRSSLVLDRLKNLS